MELTAASAGDMEALGARLAGASRPGLRLFLQGELGAGKTTLVRGFLRGLGYEGKVKSPTYTLVEPYHLSALTVYHFDFYRLQDPEELEAMGIRDYFGGEACCLVEWPERAGGYLGQGDVSIHITFENSDRYLSLQAHTAPGRALLARL